MNHGRCCLWFFESIHCHDGRLDGNENNGSQIVQLQGNGTTGTLWMGRLFHKRLHVVDQTSQTKAVSTFGNACAMQIVQANGTRSSSGCPRKKTIIASINVVGCHETFDHPHGFPRYRLVGSLPRISTVPLSRNPKGVIGRRMQWEHARTGLASGRRTIFGRPMVLLLRLLLAVASSTSASMMMTTTSTGAILMRIGSRTTARMLRWSKVKVQQLGVG